jgi:hypothetical protein
MIGATGAAAAAEPAKAEAREPLLLPREKPWKKARQVGSTESGLSSQVSYICSIMAELAWVGTVVELMKKLNVRMKNVVGRSGDAAKEQREPLPATAPARGLRVSRAR